eukprot:scaffold1138_cov128-Cylindrotheca_fusiformis.AAC.10
MSLQGFAGACLLLVLAEKVQSFSIPSTHIAIRRATKNGATSLGVMMGGSGGDITNIQEGGLLYYGNSLEDVNARAISLFEQFHDAAGFEEYMNSHDSLAQVASVLVAKGDDVQDVLVGGSSATISSLPETAFDALNGQTMMLQQLDSSILSAATTATGATGATISTSSSPDISYSDFAENAPAFGSLPDIDPLAANDPSFDQTISQLLTDNVEVAKAAASQATKTEGLEKSNKIMSLLEKTVSSFDDIATKSGDSLEDVARQLSDQLYQSFGSPEAAQASLTNAPKYIAKKGDAALQGALDEMEKVFETSTSKLVEKGTETIQAAKETPVKTILKNVLHVIEEVLKTLLKTMDGMLESFSGSSLMEHVQHFQSSLAGLVSQTTQKIGAAVNGIGDVNIQQVAEFVFKEVIFFMQVLSKLFLTLMDALLKTFTGDTLMGHIHHLQANLASAVSHTTDQLTSALHDLGQVDLKQLAMLLVSLVSFVAKIMFQILSAVVIVLSGRGLDTWTVQAAGAVKQEVTQVSAQASQAAAGVAESSISELGGLLVQLLENTSVLLVEAFQALLEAFSTLIQPGGPLSGAMAYDSIQSFADSASMMTANL